MNYIWDIYLRGKEQEISFQKVHFAPARVASPYYEASFSEINRKLLDEAPIEINGLYRFQAIVGPLQDLNITEAPELRMALYDIIMHYLAVQDMRQGLNLTEFYMLFFQDDIRAGVYGRSFMKVLDALTTPQRVCLMSAMALSYQVGTSLELFRYVIRHIYPNSIVYLYTDTKQEVLVYLGIPESDEQWDRITLICNLFLSPDMHIYIFWTHHFGIFDIDETMEIGEEMLF